MGRVAMRRPQGHQSISGTPLSVRFRQRGTAGTFFLQAQMVDGHLRSRDECGSPSHPYVPNGDGRYIVINLSLRRACELLLRTPQPSPQTRSYCIRSTASRCMLILTASPRLKSFGKWDSSKYLALSAGLFAKQVGS